MRTHEGLSGALVTFRAHSAGHAQLLALLQLPHVAIVEEVIDAVWRGAQPR